MKKSFALLILIVSVVALLFCFASCDFLSSILGNSEPLEPELPEGEYSAWKSNENGTHSRYLLSDPTVTETKDCKMNEKTAEATCVSGGYTKYTCPLCAYSYVSDRTEPDPDRHQLVFHEKRNASCTEDGWKAYYTCALCAYSSFEELPATGHDFSDWEYLNETQHIRVCRNCDVRGYADHDFTEDAAVEETCSSAGRTEGMHCAACEIVFKAQVEIPADPEKHRLVSVAAKRPGCEEEGWNAYRYCELCDYSEKTSIDPLGHKKSYNLSSDSSGHFRTCLRCSERLGVEPHENEIEEAVEPSCFRDGRTEGAHCKVCGYRTRTPEIVPRIGSHDLTEYPAAEPDCVTPGNEAYVRCSRCDYTDYKEIPALGHSKTEYPGKPATCTESGFADYFVCSRCSFSSYAELPAKGHTLVEEESETPTCLTAGHDAYSHCLNCDFTTYREIPALGHEIESHPYAEPTCVKDGCAAYETCSRCSYTTFERIPALGHHPGELQSNESGHFHLCVRCSAQMDSTAHTLVTDPRVEATCTETGLTEGAHCSVCAYVTLAQETIPAAGHSLDHYEAEDATCLSNGHTEYEACRICDYTTYTVIPALGHDEIPHEGLEPTCTESGYSSYVTCSRCDYSTYWELPANGHTIVSYDRKEATCTESGHNAYEECTCCSYTTKEETPALGHSEGSELGRDSSGHYYYCARCSIPMDLLPHTPAIDPRVEANCSRTGLTEGSHCSVCAYVILAQETIPVNEDHALVEHPAQDATCTEEGWAAYVSCSRCSYSTYGAIPALGHSPSGSYYDDSAHWAKCSRCELALTRSPHSFAIVASVSPDCVNAGENTYGCSACAYTYSAATPALGHDYVVYDNIPQTCVTYAHFYSACSRCSDSYEYTGTEYAPHQYEAETCKVCQRNELMDYYETFTLHGNDSSDLISIRDEKELRLLCDYLLFYQVTNFKYFSYPNLTLAEYADLVDRLIERITTQNWAVRYSLSGAPRYFGLCCSNTENFQLDKVATLLPGRDYAIEERAQQDFLAINRMGEARGDSFEDFPYLTRMNSVSVTSSDQLFYAFSHGYKPIPTSGSAAERMLNKAKTICREYISDDMTDVQKLYAIMQWMVAEVTYDHGAITASDSGSILWQYATAWYAEGVFDYHLAVCDGIAKAVCILAGIEDIKCVRVHGNAHAWNRVWIDDGSGEKKWFVYDATHANLGVNGSYETFALKNFLISDRQKSEFHYVAVNYTEENCAAVTEGNPYAFVHYGTAAESQSNDLVIANVTELNAVVQKLVQVRNASDTDYVTVEIFIDSAYCPTMDDCSNAVRQALNSAFCYKSFSYIGGAATYGERSGFRYMILLGTAS